MLYPVRVRSNVKGGVDVQLGQRTVVYGPNGAGKTAVVQSIELATRGWVTDMEVREQVKLHTALSRLFNEDSMFAEVEMSDGTVFEWQMQKGQKPVHSPAMRFDFPVQDLLGTLGGQANKVKSWIEEAVVGGVSEKDILSQVSPAAAQELKGLIYSMRKLDFLAVAKAARDEARRLRTEATQNEKTVAQLLVGIPTPLLEEDKTRILTELQQLEEISSMRREANRSAEARKALKVRIQEQQEKLDAAPKGDSDERVVRRVSDILSLVAAHEQKFGDAGCLVCGSGETLSDRKTELEALAESFKAAMHRERLELSLAELRREYEQLPDLRLESPNVDVEGRIETLRSQVMADQTAGLAWSNARIKRSSSARARLRADALTLAAKSLEAYGSALLEEKKQGFERGVSAFLGQEKLVVDLQSARLGLVRDDHVHTALSGAEMSRVLLAVCCYLGSSSTPSLLVPPDKAWDPNTLTRVMEALSTAPVPVLLMSTVRPKVVEGWKLLEL